MGKTYKDRVKALDLKFQKKGSRLQTKDVDMRTRVKPVHKEKGGGKNETKNIIDSYVDELEDEWKDVEDMLK